MPKLHLKIPHTVRQGMTLLNTFLNNVAMYRLVIYVLIGFAVVGTLFSFFDLAPFTPISALLSLVIILGVSLITNAIFARVFRAPTNIESVYITALILFCIITPPPLGDFSSYLSLAVWAAVWAMASKYIFAYGKKHIFNPAAFALVLTSLMIHQAGSWWIGRGDMLVFVLVGGLLIVMKIRRFDMVLSFMASALITIGTIALIAGADPLFALSTTFTDTAFLFFAFIMLTEPITTPPTRHLRIAYGVLVGFLFAPNLHLGSLYSTPEFSLVFGNIFSYLVSPKFRYALKLKERIEVATNTFDYIFTSGSSIAFRPGQYMEWTLTHAPMDSRGIRRYFTLASAPTEGEVRVGVRHYPQSSTYKKHLLSMPLGSEIVAGPLTGDFVLPTNASEKLVFIAGGIGVTPFRSMIHFLLDKKEKRTITL